MPVYTAAQDTIKRKIRSLKKLELKIRFGHLGSAERKRILSGNSYRSKLVWDEFFNLRVHHSAANSGRFTLDQLVELSQDDLKNVISEYFWHVYYRYYQENGILNTQTYDPSVLAQLGLPYNADTSAIKKQFRDLAKKYHPDTGGDHKKFIEFMEEFNKLDYY